MCVRAFLALGHFFGRARRGDLLLPHRENHGLVTTRFAIGGLCTRKTESQPRGLAEDVGSEGVCGIVVDADAKSRARSRRIRDCL